jgi:hypothetical protein
MLVKNGSIVKCCVQQAIESRRRERLAFDPGNFAGLNCRKGTDQPTPKPESQTRIRMLCTRASPQLTHSLQQGRNVPAFRSMVLRELPQAGVDRE